jgi:hypothetical protein
VAGIAIGVFYVLSPFAVWFFLVLLGCFAAVRLGLPEPERRWVVGLLSVAVALRLLAIAALFLASDHNRAASFFWDGDGVFLKQRGLWIRSVWLDVPIAPVDFGNAFSRSYGWTSYLYLIAYLQYLVGPAPYGIHLLNVAAFIATAILLHRIVRSAYGAETATTGLALLLFLPTPFMWSISAMKESLYIFFQVLAVAGVVAVVRSKSWVVKMLAVGVIAGSLSANATIRTGALAISVMGLTAGVVGNVILRRMSLAILAVALGALVGYRALNQPAVQARVMSQVRTLAVQHLGNVRTQGHAYKLLDQRFYSASYQGDPVQTLTAGEGARFVVRGVASFVLVPLPWQIESLSEILFMPQQIAWYVLVGLGLVGLILGLRRDRLVTCLLAGLAVAGATAIALNSGNIGTMVRHRDTIVPFIVWLSALGAVEVVSTLARRGAKPGRNGLQFDARAACH